MKQKLWTSFLLLLIQCCAFLKPGFRIRNQFPLIHRFVIIEDNKNNEDEVQSAKQSLVQLIDDSWNRLSHLIPKNVLHLCEADLRGATSLLVLATIKKSADSYSSSRMIVEGMLKQADSNNDGNLSYMEWYDWLVSNSNFDQFSVEKGSSTDFAYLSTAPGEKDKIKDIMSSVSVSVLNEPSTLTSSSEPMVGALSQVLSHAVYTLKITSRMSDDPAILCASFVAGGIVAGILDDDVCGSMLARLKPSTRDLVVQAVALETVSTAKATKQKKTLFLSSVTKDKNIRKSGLLSVQPPYSRVLNNSRVLDETEEFRVGNSRDLEMNKDILMAVDLSTIPVLTAPPIEDNLKNESAETNIKDYLSSSEEEIQEEGREGWEFEVSAAGTISRIEDEISFSEKKPKNTNLGLGDNEINTEGENLNMGLAVVPKELGSRETVMVLTDKVSQLLSDAEQLRQSLADLDDPQAKKLRMLLWTKSSQRRDVLGLSLALRGARLKHASKKLPAALRHQLALETLQLWAPLSFQAGLSSHTPELEVHSYIHLFPRSFGSFISWYSAFRPLAKKILNTFQKDFSKELQKDDEINSLCAKITLQSRLKTPSSAFKKMLKGAKQREELFDILGMRLIAFPRNCRQLQSQITEVEPTSIQLSSNLTLASTSNTQLPYQAEKQLYQVFLEQKPENKNVTNNKTCKNNKNEKKRNLTIAEELLEEKEILQKIRNTIINLKGWEENLNRYKDYVTYPKPSGYQSLHMSICHLASGISMEVQIRSDRMDWIAEYGPASHSNYKALLLPSEIQQ